MSDYIIAIPSYKRANTLRDKTLALLELYQIDPSRIYIFVADEEEKKLYEKTLPKYYKKLVVGVPGMGAIRNFITDYFEEGQKLFNIDDDITDIWELITEKNQKTGTKPEKKSLTDLDAFIRQGFDLCEKTKLNLFSIYPASNAFFMSLTVTDDLRYCIGSMWGCINRKEIKVTLDDKEDFERTIKFYLRDGGVLRFNNITPISAYYTEAGGMQETRTKERITKSADKLFELYGPETKYALVSYNTAKKGEFTEVKLKDKFNRFYKARKLRASV